MANQQMVNEISYGKANWNHKRTSETASWVKGLAVKPETSVQSQEAIYIWKKERTDFHKLFSDLHICAVAHAQLDTHIYTHKINVIKKNLKPQRN